MRDELRRFPGKDEIVAGLIAPRLDGIEARRPIKDAVQLGALKPVGVVLQLLFEGKATWKKWPSPGVVVPPRCADQNTCHGLGLRTCAKHWSIEQEALSFLRH